MRLLVPALMLVLLIPTTAAIGFPPGTSGDEDVGPCHADWFYDPNTQDAGHARADCTVRNTEVVAVGQGQSIAGPWCYVRVAGETVHQCR